MTKRGRKRKGNEEDISITPEEEIEEVIEEEDHVVPEIIFPSIIEIELPSPPELPKTKKIKYLGVDVLITKGPVTGKRYRFTAKDRISEVAIEDYDGLLKKVRSAHKCCGRKAGDPGRTVPSQPYFGSV